MDQGKRESWDNSSGPFFKKLCRSHKLPSNQTSEGLFITCWVMEMGMRRIMEKENTPLNLNCQATNKTTLSSIFVFMIRPSYTVYGPFYIYTPFCVFLQDALCPLFYNTLGCNPPLHSPFPVCFVLRNDLIAAPLYLGLVFKRNQSKLNKSWMPEGLLNSWRCCTFKSSCFLTPINFWY